MTTIDYAQIVTADEEAAGALDACKAEARQSLIAQLDAAAEAVTGAVPLAERLSWSEKAAAASAVLAGTATTEQEALLSGEAEVTGETVAALAGRIVARAEQYRATVGRLAGLRRATEAAIDAAVAPADVDAVLATFAEALTSPAT